MQTEEYSRLVLQLDGELKTVHDARENRSRVETAVRCLGMLRVQRRSLEARRIAFDRLGTKPSADLSAIIASMKDEEARLEKEIAHISTPDSTPSAPSPSSAILEPTTPFAKLDRLIAVLKTMKICELPIDHAVALFTVWALEWRLLSEHFGEIGTQKTRGMRLAYALIREAMTAYPYPLPYIPALERKNKGDWQAELTSARHALEHARAHPAPADWRRDLERVEFNIQGESRGASDRKGAA